MKKILIIILFFTCLKSRFIYSKNSFFCNSSSFNKILVKSNEHKKMYEAKKFLVNKITNNLMPYNQNNSLLAKNIQMEKIPFSYAEFIENHEVRQRMYSIKKDFKFDEFNEKQSVFVGGDEYNHLNPEDKIASFFLKNSQSSISGDLKVFFLKSKVRKNFTLLNKLKEERPGLNIIAYIWDNEEKKVDEIFLNHSKYITLPIAFKTDIETVYRLDARPPSIILSRGFEGTSNVLPNKIFGDRTVFSSKDESGSKFFYREVVKAYQDTRDPQIGGRKLYLYKINSLGFPAVELKNSVQNIGLDQFSFQLASRNYVINSETDQYVNFDAYIRAKDYLKLVARFNKEVQIAGPIPTHRIEFIKEMPEIN